MRRSGFSFKAITAGFNLWSVFGRNSINVGCGPCVGSFLSFKFITDEFDHATITTRCDQGTDLKKSDQQLNLN